MADVAIRIPGIQRMPGGFRRRNSNYNLQRRDVTECAQWCDDSHRPGARIICGHCPPNCNLAHIRRAI